MKERADTLADSERTAKLAGKLTLEAERFCQCGTLFSLLACENDRQVFRSPLSCNSRICERCGRRYARRLEPGIKQVLGPLFNRRVRGFGVFMLTLTTTTDRFDVDGPSRIDIERFYRESGAFLRLYYGKHKCRLNRKGKVIEVQNRIERIRRPGGKVEKRRRKPTVKKRADGSTVEDWRHYRGAGYLSSVELGGQNNMLHCHAIVYGPFIPIRVLKQTWAKLTGDSFIVDIRAVRKVRDAARYVLKYIVKPPAADSFQTIADYAWRIKGTRRLRTGGIFYNRVRKTVLETLPCVCPYCGNRLRMSGQVSIDDKEDHYSRPLYPLLRECQARGSPLPLPERATTMTQRVDSAIYRRAAQVDQGIQFLDTPITLESLGLA